MAGLVGREKTRAGEIRLPQQRAIQFGRVADRLVYRQPQIRWMNDQVVFAGRNRLRVEFSDHFFSRLPGFLQPGIFFKILVADALRAGQARSEEHTSELQSLTNLVCRLLLEKKKTTTPDEMNGTSTTSNK